MTTGRPAAGGAKAKPAEFVRERCRFSVVRAVRGLRRRTRADQKFGDFTFRRMTMALAGWPEFRSRRPGTQVWAMASPTSGSPWLQNGCSTWSLSMTRSGFINPDDTASSIPATDLLRAIHEKNRCIESLYTHNPPTRVWVGAHRCHSTWTRAARTEESTRWARCAAPPMVDAVSPLLLANSTDRAVGAASDELGRTYVLGRDRERVMSP